MRNQKNKETINETYPVEIDFFFVSLASPIITKYKHIILGIRLNIATKTNNNNQSNQKTIEYVTVVTQNNKRIVKDNRNKKCFRSTQEVRTLTTGKKKMIFPQKTWRFC